MMRSLFSGVAGLKTHQVKMDVIGNNIANVNTTSFKSQSITFSDLMYQTTQRASKATERTGGINARQIGLGSKSGAIGTAIKTQGATETTNNPFDMRITGDAFYIVNDGNQTLYTRDGSFYVDGAGNLAMQSTGYFVYGWTAMEDPDTGEISVNTNGGIGKLQIMSAANMTYPPEGTTEGVVSGNIDANDMNVISDAGKTVTLEFYDNLGYLYTAKFAVRDVDDIEHTYTMTLEDILDSKGNTIGAEKLSYVAFTDNTDGNGEETYGVRGTYEKTTRSAKYTVGGYSSTKVSFRDKSGATAYSGIPTTGIVSALASNEKTQNFLEDVYELAGVDQNGYYEINEDGSITIYTVMENDGQGANIGANNGGSDILSSYYVASTSEKAIVYKDLDKKSVAIDRVTTIDASTIAGIAANKKAVFKDLFGIDLDDATKFDFGTAASSNTYTISLDQSGLIATLEKTTVETTKATYRLSSDYTYAGTDTKGSLLFDNGDGDLEPIDATGDNLSSLPDEVMKVYNLQLSKFPRLDPPSYYEYSINVTGTPATNDDFGKITITTHTSTTKDLALTNLQSGVTVTNIDTANNQFTYDVNGTPVTVNKTGNYDATTVGQLADVFKISPKTDDASNTYTYSYTIADDGESISVKQTRVKVKDKVKALGRAYNVSSSDATSITVNDGSGYKAITKTGTLDNLNTNNSKNLLEVFDLDADDFPAKDVDETYSYAYEIIEDASDPNNIKYSVEITTTTTTPVDSESTRTNKKYVADVDDGAGTVLYKTVEAGAAVGSSIPLKGTLNTTVKSVLTTVFGYNASSDNISYEISADGSQLKIYDKGGGDVTDIAIATERVNLTLQGQVNESTASYINVNTGKTVYDSIPRTGYVSELNDATATSEFFVDVYNYSPDPNSADYENLTYHILDDGTLQVVNNSVTLRYDAKTGDITYPTGKIVLNFDQAAVIDGQPKMAGFTDVNMDFSSTTNYNTSATSTIGAVKGDLQSLKTGRSVGEMNGITIGKDGTIYATYSNGQTKLLGQIATAEFANASGLEKQGDNLYASTLNSGEATVQDVTMDGGYITTGVLEMSNVDLSSEFTNMITTQRGFQANSRIITVSDTLLEELTNLKR